ncbi:hypothetical protein Tco_0603804 [Tanacetum coccineum]
MAVAAMKHMALKFAKLDKFEGVDFRRWQKKMHLLLSSMSVVYLLTTHILKDGENATVDQIRRRNKKKLWDSLEEKYMAEDASSKKFLVSNFTNYKITSSRPVMEQYNELLDFKHTLKHNKEELTFVELDSHLCIEESFREQDSDKQRATMLFVHSNWTWLNIVNDNIGSAFMSTSKLNDSILWHARLGYVHFKRIDLCDLHATPSLGNKKYFMTFIDDASRFYVIEPNESVSINSIIKSRDAIFDENRFLSVPRPSQRSLINRTEDIGSSVAPEKDDPKTFDEAIKSQDFAFWKKAINDEMDSIMGNNTWVLIDLPPSCKPLG